ncbi:MAG: GIY-YIG nuclease family protein [Nitrospirota bacterium]
MGFYVYALKSKSTGRSYIGHSKELNNRVAEHNADKGKSTRGRGPWELVYYEEYESRSDAIKREYFFKSQPGRLFLKGKNILE